MSGPVDDGSPLDDPIAEKLRKQRLVEEADFKATMELFGTTGASSSLPPGWGSQPRSGAGMPPCSAPEKPCCSRVQVYGIIIAPTPSSCSEWHLCGPPRPRRLVVFAPARLKGSLPTASLLHTVQAL